MAHALIYYRLTRFFSLTLIISIILTSIMPVLAEQPGRNKVVITGRLVWKNGSPIPYADLMVSPFKDGKTFLRTDNAGVLLNPTAVIREKDVGRFRLELDLDNFEKEEFVITAKIGFLSGEALLRDRNGIVIVLEFAKPVENFDLGDIVVE